MDLLVSYAWGRFFRARAEINCAGRDPYPGGVDNWRKFDIDSSPLALEEYFLLNSH